MDRYYFDDGKSRKLWSIAVQGKSVVATSGALGAKGRESTKTFADAKAAKTAAKSAAEEKVKQGYVRIDPSLLKIDPLEGVRKATEAQVAKFEKQIGARLPDEYRNLVLSGKIGHEGDDWHLC